jgi:DnaJ-class molecular chaperone
MSSLKQTLEIHVGDFAPYSRNERFVGNVFPCPLCKGRGGFLHEVGHNKFERTVCTHCDGAGKIRPTITIQWNPEHKSNDPGKSL